MLGFPSGARRWPSARTDVVGDLARPLPRRGRRALDPRPGGWSACPEQAAGLQVQEVPGGYLVSPALRGRGHYLSPVACLPLGLCDGRTKVADVPILVQAAYRLPTPPA